MALSTSSAISFEDMPVSQWFKQEWDEIWKHHITPH